MSIEKGERVMVDLYGCSDHNCIYGHAGGMGTNGGCRCEKELHRIGPEGIKAARQIRLLRAENERLREEKAAKQWYPIQEDDYGNKDTTI